MDPSGAVRSGMREEQDVSPGLSAYFADLLMLARGRRSMVQYESKNSISQKTLCSFSSRDRPHRDAPVDPDEFNPGRRQFSTAP
jgi:hypothetical protein